MNNLKTSLTIAAGGSIMISAAITTFEWFNNPSQIFSDQTGTNWFAIAETFWSWLWPLFIVTLGVLVVIWVLARKLKAAV